MTTIQIRPATIHDAAPLSTLATTVFSDTYGAMIPPDTLQKHLEEQLSPEALKADLTHLSSHYLVARDACVAHDKETLIGFSKLSPSHLPSTLRSTRSIEIVKLYVANPYHGFGIGAKLMKRSLSKAKELGYESIWLCVWEKNERAIAFYRKWGFEKVGMIEILVGDVVFDDFVLEKTLVS
ncbi:MAG: GNAT family N-acetyltransferase [Ardenticatenaceae bacterium]